jgi:hypothetical protein
MDIEIKMKNARVVFSILMAVGFGMIQSGCALFLLGAGAAGGYAISKDEIEGMTDVSYNKIWNAANQVVRRKGIAVLSNHEQGRLEADIENSKVEVQLDQVTKSTVRLRVKARRANNLFPNIKLAQRLFTDIFKQV